MINHACFVHWGRGYQRGTLFMGRMFISTQGVSKSSIIYGEDV